jgi:hypothetical protein
MLNPECRLLILQRTAHTLTTLKVSRILARVARFGEGYPGFQIHSTHHSRAERGERSEYLLFIDRSGTSSQSFTSLRKPHTKLCKSKP